MASSSKVWSIFSLAAALGAAAIAKKGLNTSWKAATGKNPPANPADPAPYWLISTRRPDDLARALTELTESTAAG